VTTDYHLQQLLPPPAFRDPDPGRISSRHFIHLKDLLIRSPLRGKAKETHAIQHPTSKRHTGDPSRIMPDGHGLKLGERGRVQNRGRIARLRRASWVGTGQILNGSTRISGSELHEVLRAGVPGVARPDMPVRAMGAAHGGLSSIMPDGHGLKRGERGRRASWVGTGQTKKAQYGRWPLTWSFCFPSGAQARLAWPKKGTCSGTDCPPAAGILGGNRTNPQQLNPAKAGYWAFSFAPFAEQAPRVRK
jgi:hypothetical protein